MKMDEISAHFLPEMTWQLWLVFRRKRQSKIVIVFFFHRPQSRWFMCIVEFGQKLALWIPTLDDNSTEPSMAAASSHFGDLCADSRALFRAGRQLLQVGSHDI